MCDTDEDLHNLVKKKNAQRKANKAYFQKLVTNPHRPLVDTAIFDPVAFRYAALTQYQIEFYRMTPKSLMPAFCFMIVPIVFISWLHRKTSVAKEKELRAGKVAYKDRDFKLIL